MVSRCAELALAFPKYYPRQWVGRSVPAYKNQARRPPKYHPRKWVDRSFPACKTSPAALRNTTQGSGWIFHSQPTKRRTTPASEIPPTEVGGSFIFQPAKRQARRPSKYHPRKWVEFSFTTYKKQTPRLSGIPSHGSGWIFQFQPAFEPLAA